MEVVPDSGRRSAADVAWEAVTAFVATAPDGSRLPPEREFAAQLGVSRSTLRAALARLELLGLVETRHGAGVFVRRPDPSRQLGLLLQAAGQGGEVTEQALDLRTLIEPQLAAAAARAKPRPDLAAAEDDEGFHAALAAAGGNALAGLLVSALVGLSGPTRLPGALHEAQHAAVVAAVAAGDTEAAREAMALHLRSLKRAAARER